MGGIRADKPPVELDPARLHEQQPDEIDEETFLRVLDRCQRVLEQHEIPFGLIGGIASACLGRPRWTHDIDLFVRPEDAAATLAALRDDGFETHETNKHWIFKAWRDRVLVDVIFRARGDIYLDDKMVSHLRDVEFKGIRVRTLAPEDLIVIKAIIYDEETPRHWYDALGILTAQDIDWDYLIERSAAGTRRILSLLIFAQSTDTVVPDSVIHRLVREAYPL